MKVTVLFILHLQFIRTVLKFTKQVRELAVFTRSILTMVFLLMCSVIKKQPAEGGQCGFRLKIDGSVDFYRAWDDYKPARLREFEWRGILPWIG